MSRIFEKHKKLSAFWFFFLTSLLTIAFPMFLSFAFLHNTISYMEQQTTDRRQKQEHDIEQIVSTVYKDAYQLGYKVAVNSQIRTYSIAQERDSETEYEIVSYLKNIVNMEYYQNCFVYFPQHDRIISATQSSPVVNYLSEIYKKDQISVLNLLEDSQENGIAVTDETEPSRKRLFFVRSITSNTGTDQNVKVLVEWNLSYLKERMSLLIPESDTCFLGTPETCVLVIGSALAEEENEETYQAICQSGEQFAEGEETKRIGLQILSPDTSELKLYYLEGETSALKLYFRTFSFAGIELLLCALVSVGLVCYFGKYHTSKLRNIIDVLTREKSAAEIRERNEYEQILSYVDLYQKDYVNISEQSSRYRCVCQKLYMRNVLLGNVQDKNSIRETLQLYEIDFPYDYYALLLFSVDAEIPEEGINDEVEIHVMEDAIRAEIFSWIAPENHVFLMEMSGRYVCILNLERFVEENKNYAEQMAESILQIFKSFGLYGYCCQKSEVFQGADKIADYYKDMICASVKENKGAEPEKKIGECVQRCLEIIRTRYSDTELSTDWIAEQLSVSRSYLSSSFKQQIGIGLLEYIHRYRISEFKKEIQNNPQIRLREAAERIGFANQASLIRVFKKIEGITPGQYRDEVLQKQKRN